MIISEIHELQMLVFREVDGVRSFPLAVGIFEATSIDRRLKGLSSPRPLTFDAFAATITALSGKLRDVIINELKDTTYYARLRILQARSFVFTVHRLVEVDVRPSDAVALALAFAVPILIPEMLLSAVCDQSR